MEIEYS